MLLELPAKSCYTCHIPREEPYTVIRSAVYLRFIREIPEDLLEPAVNETEYGLLQAEGRPTMLRIYIRRKQEFQVFIGR